MKFGNFRKNYQISSIMKIKDTRKIKDFPVSTGNLRFPLDFQDTENLRFSRVLPKCLSNDNMTLPSDLAISDINSSLEPRAALLTSKPLLAKNSKTNFGIFSSVRSFNLPDSDIFFLFEKLGGVFNSRQDGFLRELREVIPNNLFWSNARSKQGKNLPDHDTSIFESKLSMADFTVRNNKFIDFVSHGANNANGVFKFYENKKFSI